MYIKKYICTTYVKYHSTSLSSPPVIPHLMRDPSPPVIPHLMRDPFSLDSRLRGNDGRGAGMTHPFVILNRLPRCHPQPKAKRFGLGIQLDLDSRLRGNNGRGVGMTHPLSSSTESEALRIGDPFSLDSRFRGNDRRGAGMTRVGAGMTKRRYGNDGRNKNNDR